MTTPAPMIGNGSIPAVEQLLLPTGEPYYRGIIYPYLASSNVSNASASTNYGQSAGQWLPEGYNDSSAQTILPAGGGLGGNPGLWEPVLNVSATIKNIGHIAGHEVAQLYVELGADEPPKVLRGFDRLFIQPGETATFAAQLLRRDLSIWDVERQDWVLRNNVTIFVGASSRKLPLMQVVSM